MIHLAYVTMTLAPFDEGGPATVAHCLLKNLVKEKDDVRITLIVGDSVTEKDITNTLGNQFENIVRIPLERSIHAYTHVIMRKMNEVWQAFDYIDIVHLNDLRPLRNFYLPFFASLRRKPIVCTFHSLFTPEIQGLFYGEKARAAKTRILRAINRLYESSWSRIVVNSLFVKKAVLEKGIGENRIRLIRNGIDFDGIENAPRVNLEGDIKLLFVGAIKYVKGVDLLLEALSLLKPTTRKKTKLYVVGSGPREEEYKSLATSLKVDRHVKFLGHLPLDKCYSLYKSCDMLVFPSRFEGFPMTLLEALGSGLPIIATNVGGTPEIVKDGRNGLLVESDALEIAQKIQFLIDHPEDRKRISRNNLTDAEEYSWKILAQQYLLLYKSLIRRKTYE